VQRAPHAAALEARQHAAAEHRPRLAGRKQDRAREPRDVAVHERQAHALRRRVGIAQQPLDAVAAGIHVELLQDLGRSQHGHERVAIVGVIRADGRGHGGATLVTRAAAVNGSWDLVDRGSSGP
jgi:hypothetical protein